MLYEGRVESMDDTGRAWCVVPALLGADAIGPIPIMKHVTTGVVVDAGVYVAEVAHSEDRFVIVGVMA